MPLYEPNTVTEGRVPKGCKVNGIKVKFAFKCHTEEGWCDSYVFPYEVDGDELKTTRIYGKVEVMF